MQKEEFYETMIYGYLKCINQNFNDSKASLIVPSQWFLMVSVLIIPLVIGLLLAAGGVNTSHLVTVLIGDVIQNIKNKDTKGALSHLTLADQQVSTNGNSTLKQFIEEAIEAIKHNQTKEAFTPLSLLTGLSSNWSNNRMDHFIHSNFEIIWIKEEYEEPVSLYFVCSKKA